jgi:hypothetical protein
MLCLVVRIHALYVRLRVRQNEQIRIRSTASKSLILGGKSETIIGGRSNDIQVEKFKRSFHSRDSLHAKYSSRTGQPVVADNEWGHLQIGEYTLHPVLRIFLGHDPGIFVASGSISLRRKKL